MLKKKVFVSRTACYLLAALKLTVFKENINLALTNAEKLTLSSFFMRKFLESSVSPLSWREMLRHLSTISLLNTYDSLKPYIIPCLYWDRHSSMSVAVLSSFAYEYDP